MSAEGWIFSLTKGTPHGEERGRLDILLQKISTQRIAIGDFFPMNANETAALSQGTYSQITFNSNGYQCGAAFAFCHGISALI
jgi:hypothetical protein